MLEKYAPDLFVLCLYLLLSCLCRNDLGVYKEFEKPVKGGYKGNFCCWAVCLPLNIESTQTGLVDNLKSRHLRGCPD